MSFPNDGTNDLDKGPPSLSSFSNDRIPLLTAPLRFFSLVVWIYSTLASCTVLYVHNGLGAKNQRPGGGNPSRGKAEPSAEVLRIKWLILAPLCPFYLQLAPLPKYLG